jgi:hypothetical protein
LLQLIGSNCILESEQTSWFDRCTLFTFIVKNVFGRGKWNCMIVIIALLPANKSG